VVRKALNFGQYQPDSPGRANNNDADNDDSVCCHVLLAINEKSLSQVNEKGFKLWIIPA